MVKTPKMRHSKAREPLTIDLDPQSVSHETPVEPSEPVEDGAPGEAIIVRDETLLDATPDVGGDASAEVEPESPVVSEEPASSSGYEAADTNEQPAYVPRDPPPSAEAPPRQGRDTFSRIAAGAIGAVVALALAGGAQYAGLLGYPGASTGGADTQGELDGLRQEIAALKQAPAASATDSRVDALVPALDAVKADLASLHQAVAAGGGGDAAAAQALDARIKAVETAVASLSQQGAGSSPADTAGLAEKITAIESSLAALGEKVTAEDTRLATLENSMSALSTKVDGQAAQPGIALAVATAALKSATERGTSFASELDTLAALAPDRPEIAALRPYAEKGVPSHDMLVEAMEPAATAMLAAATPVDANAGVLDRLLNSAESLVTVRPIGAVEGDSVGAIIARMEVALKAGDIDAAVAEFDTLPEPVKAAGGSFAEGLKARQAVDKLVEQAIASAMKA